CSEGNGDTNGNGGEGVEGSADASDTSSSLSTRLLRWRILRQKRHEKLRKFRTNFDIVEMPEHMQTDAIEFASEGLAKYGDDYDEAADHMCRMIEKKYREVWSCIIGQNFGYSIEEPEPGKFMLFYIGNVNRIRVMAFISKN
ncbi:unnamed protein product, partial [Oppiella nova]